MLQQCDWASFGAAASAETFAEIWGKRTQVELQELAHVKRFMECLTGDPVFREKLEASNPEFGRVAAEYGIDIEPALMLPLFHRDYMKYRFEDADDRWPIARRWDAYFREMLAHRSGMVGRGDTEAVNPRFHRWRRRQIARVRTEIGAAGAGIVHPIVAYELSKGCTIGCWFCGISAGMFGGYLAFEPEGERLWREVLAAMVGRFGSAAGTGFCYWATDPMDNPDYAKFIRVHAEITGMLPQTTTAAPLRAISRTREVLELFKERRQVINRFSILSVAQLRRVHREFSPQELLGVELVLQNSGALMTKTLAGRALQKKFGNQSVDRSQRPGVVGTIACVTGFLVNLMDCHVRLVSPTKACHKWPNGYRIHDELSFKAAGEFGQVIDRLIERNMRLSVSGKDVLSFRSDLKFEARDDGFELLNDEGGIKCCGSDLLKRIGEVVRQSDKTVSDAIEALTTPESSPFSVMRCLEELYQSGVLED